jgi:hypothetical protein
MGERGENDSEDKWEFIIAGEFIALCIWFVTPFFGK